MIPEGIQKPPLPKSGGDTERTKTPHIFGSPAPVSPGSWTRILSTQIISMLIAGNARTCSRENRDYGSLR